MFFWYEWVSLIVMFNKVFGWWGEVFGGDDVVVVVMIDCFVYYVEVVVFKGDSYWFKDCDFGCVLLVGIIEE